MSATLAPEAAPAEQSELILAGPRPIKPLRRVSAYETSDGAVFVSRPEAELREAEIAISALSTRLCDDNDLLHDHADEIHAALSTLLKAQAKAREKMQAPAAEVVS